MTKSALLPCVPKPLSGSAMKLPGVADGIIPENPGIGWALVGGCQAIGRTGELTRDGTWMAIRGRDFSPTTQLEDRIGRADRRSDEHDAHHEDRLTPLHVSPHSRWDVSRRARTPSPLRGSETFLRRAG